MPSSIRRLAVTWLSTQRSGQLIARVLPGRLHGRDHRAGVGDRGGEGLFDEDMDAVGGQALV
jgi:hypothetical protein